MAQDPERPKPRTPRWVGTYVVWWGGDDWEFIACVRCEKELRSARAKKNGYGPECAKHLPTGLVGLVLQQERRRCAAAIRRSDPAPPPRRNRRERRAAKGNVRWDPNAQQLVREPTAKQIALLKNLCAKKGRTFEAPRTLWEASAQIDRLLGKKPRKRKK